MNPSMQSKAEQLGGEIASQGKTIENLNGLMPYPPRSSQIRHAVLGPQRLPSQYKPRSLVIAK